MVAGQPIQTQAQTPEWDSGYERIFGKDRKPQRGRYVFNPETGACEEVGSDWSDAPRKALTSTEEIAYGNLQTTDGVDISSRKKRREYMKASGVTDSSDFSKDWFAKQAKSKERQNDAQRKADLITSYKQLRKE
jgi:hypothetical protein